MKYIVYYRVSTRKQGNSGLGLEGQKRDVETFARNRKGQIIESYTDIESGSKNNRPELLKAIIQAKKTGSTLLIAKLDRLSRNASFILDLQNSKVKFVACDCPEADETVIGIMSVLAQQERNRIVKRVTEALQVKKERDGEWRKGYKETLTNESRAKSKKSLRLKVWANHNNLRAIESVKDKVRIYELSGTKINWSHIAQELNNSGFKTAKGKEFQAVQVQRLFKYAKTNGIS